MRQDVSPSAQKELFRRHKKLNQEFAEVREQFVNTRIAVLSGVTIHPLCGILEALALEEGINPTFFEGDYNAYMFDAQFSDALVDFKPEIIYFHTSVDNIIGAPDISASQEEATAQIATLWSEMEAAFNATLKRTNATIIVNNFEYPSYRINGNYEAVAPGGSVTVVNEINMRLANLARSNSRVVLNDVCWLASRLGLENWRDDKTYAAFKQPFSARAQTEIALSLTALMRSIRGHSAKGLILDLDNTMWGGVVGDDGVDGVKIGQGDATSEAYLKFQNMIRPLLRRGIAFAACSKNESAIAKTALNRDEMVIKEDDFHVLRINWNPKSKNINEIQKALNVGMDALVFIDDSAFERSEVRQALPALNVPEVDAHPLSYLKALSDSYAFETTTVSNDDLRRGDSLKALVDFTEAQNVQSNDEMTAFLRSQKMAVSIDPVTSTNLDRVHQLVNKTNQFNLTTTRLNIAEVEAFAQGNTMLTVSLRDKNTNYGLVSVLWGARDGDDFLLQNWVMSCRVFNRKLEHVVFLHLYRLLIKADIKKIKASFHPTAKNKPVSSLLTDLGMTIRNKDNGSVYYENTLPDAKFEELEQHKELFT